MYDFREFLIVIREDGNELSALCPFHDERKPSFSANEASGLWQCHAGCGSGTFSMFLNMIKRGIKNQVSSNCGSNSLGAKIDWARYRKTAEYLYINLNGIPLLKIFRYEDSSGNKTFIRRYCPGKTEAFIGLLAPYRYEDWKNSPDPLILVEGEKCVDFLYGKGFKAATFAGGSNGWKKENVWSYREALKGRQIIILPDNDGPGKKFASDVFFGLQDVAQVQMIVLPNLNHAEDVFDWFKNGGKINEFNGILFPNKP